MEEVQVKVLDIDGNDYILIDTIENNGHNYCYYVRENDSSDVQILKSIVENGKEVLISLDTDKELDDAIILFSEKYNNSDLK